MTAKELKASILQLAVTGKLVPQDPDDEPASVLLERIKVEKAKLVKAGKIKKDKNPSEIVVGSDGAVYEKFGDGTVRDISDELPFMIPENWKWSRLTDITEFLHRGKSPIYVPKSGCPMFAQKCNQWDGIHLEKCKFCSETKYRSYPVEYHLHDCDIVINSTGTGTLGRVGLFATSELEQYGFKSIVPDSHVTIVRTPDETLNRFIFQYLRTDLMWKWMNEIADGSTKQKELYTSTLAALLIPIPPTDEQVRIMRKIEKLMPLVEEYGKKEATRLQLDADLPTALEKSVLQEAIQGKLVPQDPNDEPAIELLKRVAAERKALIKAGELKRDKGESIIFRGSDRLAYETRDGETVCIQDDIPFDIPDSWEWVRLSSLCDFYLGKTPTRGMAEYWSPADVPWVSIADMIQHGHITRTKEHTSKYALDTGAAGRLSPPGTLLMSFKLTIGKVSILDCAASHNEAIISIVPFADRDLVIRNYLFMVLPTLTKYTRSLTAIMGNTLNKKTLSDLLIPLPPIEEQRRIIGNIDSLRTLIKSLTK